MAYQHDRQWMNMLPIGFHFDPTDEELINYLKLKSIHGIIPSGIFNDINIYQYEPQQLYGSAERQWNDRMYFFSPLKKKSENGNKVERVIESKKVFWKSTQARQDLLEKNNIIGTKTSLAYYELSPKNSKVKKKTCWLMSEYRFPKGINYAEYELTLCVIYYHSKKKNVDDQIAISAELDDLIPLQFPSDQNFNNLWSAEYSQYQLLINNGGDVASSSTMQPIQFPPYQNFNNLPYTSSSAEYSQNQLLINNRGDVASSSTMELIPDGAMDNFDANLYFNDLDNFEIDDIPFSPISQDDIPFSPISQDDIPFSPISQDDQRPSTDSQDHQQLKKMKMMET